MTKRPSTWLCPAYWNKRAGRWVGRKPRGRWILLDHYHDQPDEALKVARQNHARLVWFRVTLKRPKTSG